jgi:DNA repair protein RecN (Recombination protein N)
LVEKRDSGSLVRELTQEERVLELARMVSGESITPEAKELALSLIKEG